MLHKSHCPATFDDVAGFPRQLAILRRLAQSDHGGAVLLVGPSGVGKTTIANIIAGRAKPSMRADLEGDRCGVQAVHDFASRLKPASIGWDLGWFCVTVNECHRMTHAAVAAWLNLLDNLPPRVMVIFTTTERPPVQGSANEQEAFESRCLALDLDPDEATKDAFASRLLAIAQAEGVGGATQAQARALLARHRWNLRRAINELPKGALIADTATLPAVDHAMRERLLGKARAA